MTFLKRYFLLFTLIFSFSGLQAQSKFIEGKDYQKLEIEIPLHKKGQPEVVEYFWYGCPHCFHIYPAVTKWVKKNKPKDVAFYHVPATSGNWEFAAKAMYIADKLKLDKDKFDKAYFDEIHTIKNRGVAFNEEVFGKFLKDKFKVEKANYEKAKKSLQVKGKMKAAQNRNLLADITSVPVFVVNGKYLVTTEMAENVTKMFEVINGLLEQDKTGDVKKHEVNKTEGKNPKEKKPEESQAS